MTMTMTTDNRIPLWLAISYKNRRRCAKQLDDAKEIYRKDVEKWLVRGGSEEMLGNLEIYGLERRDDGFYIAIPLSREGD